MRALIVDDDPDMRLFLTRTLQSLGIEGVDSVSSCEEALGKLVVEKFDLVTLDVEMPGFNGLEILSVIRGIEPQTVIAVITGYPEKVDDRSREYADLVLFKPVPLGKISQLVFLTDELVSKRRAIRELSQGKRE